MQNKAAPFVRLRFAVRTAVLVAGVCALGSEPLFAQTYTFTQLDVPTATFTEARALNDSGQVVGEFKVGTGPTTAFIYSSGTFTTFSPTGAAYTQAVGINSGGEVVGSYRDASSVWHAFLRGAKGKAPRIATLDPAGSTSTFGWGVNDNSYVVGSFTDAGTPSSHGFLLSPKGSKFTTLNAPGVTTGFTSAFGINAFADVAGLYATTSTGAYHGFTNIGGTYATLDPAGSVETHALGINSTDAVAGFYVTASNVTHAFLYRPGIGFTVIDPPGSTFTVATGINNSGQVVGYFFDTQYHGYVYTNGTYTILDPPGADGNFVLANGINSNGQVAGEFQNAGGPMHGFLATP